MTRPLIWMFISYLLGILGGQYCLTISSAVLFFVFSILIIIYQYKKYKWNGILIFPLLLMLGYIRIEQSKYPTDILLESFLHNNEVSHRVQIIGIVEDIEYSRENQSICIIHTKKIIYLDKVFIKPVKIKGYIKHSENIRHGDILHIEGEILPFEPIRNPGGWNEILYMKTRGIDYKFFGDLINRKTNRKTFINTIYEFRDKWADIYDKLLPSNEAAILKTMILGEKDGLKQEQKIMYQQAGISHILSISGLHISIIALLLWWIFRTIRIPNSVSTYCILFLLWIYCFFTGLSISTVRAVLMVTVVLLGKVLRRNHDICTSIAVAAFIILIKQPLYLWDAGFQLSFIAVLGLIFLEPIFSKIFWIPKKIRVVLAPTLGAGLATLPIVAYHFNYISIIGFIINMFIVPLSSFVVWFGFIGGILGFFWINGAKFIIGTVYYILCFCELISAFFIQLPYSNLITGTPNIWVTMAYYIICIILILYFSYRIQFDLNKRILYCIPIICFLLWSYYLIKSKHFELAILDVGQGDAIAIHTKTNMNILIDGGEKDSQRVLIPYFRYKGISSLDGVFLTHPDKDHILGLIGILGQIDIKKIFVSVEDDGQDVTYHHFISKAKELGIPCYFLKRGDIISFDDVYLHCLYPKSNEIKFKHGSWNEISMVLQITYKKHSFLLTGDIEQAQEDNIVNSYKAIKTDFLKVPHHGSKTSSCELFLNWCKPKTALISCGKNNRYGHPNHEVLERYNQNNIPVITTASSGAIIISSDGRDYIVNTMVEKNRGNEYERVKRTNQKKYFSSGIFILWGGAILKKILFRRNREENSTI